jgi:polyhydroxyalkanoate synthase
MADQSVDVGLDGLLVRAADQRRLIPGADETLQLALGLARRPGAVARRAGGLGQELGAIAAGSSDRAPARGDRRFGDPGWSKSWLSRRLLQGYLAVGETVEGLIDDAQLDWEHRERVRTVATNVIDALSPANNPVTNPAALKATVEEGGANLVRGARALARDARSPARIPANYDPEPFAVGENLAASPGAVVLRDELFELLQFAPTTEEVREYPLVIVPPMISKYYVVDLAPERSLVEYLTGRGQQVFSISWCQPSKENADWDLQRYVAGIIEALETARRITRAKKVHVLGLCAGGVATACTLARLADVGELDTVAGASFCVTILDTDRAGTIASVVTPGAAKAAVAKVQKQGKLDRNELARTFAWLRPNDMIWNNWVNNYLLGNRPPAFDLLFWNADSMDMPAGLHKDFVGIGVDNPLGTPGAIKVLDSPVDVGAIGTDAYVVAGETDHITPWPNCYRTTAMLGGDVRFVLSNGGHIAAVINPPGNPKATYTVGANGNPPDSAAWRKTASATQGTWWEDWDAWLAARGGETRPAPKRLGNRRHPKLGPAPGTYVLQR